MLEKLQRAYQTLSGHFVAAYLGGSKKLRANLFFIYGHDSLHKKTTINKEIDMPLAYHFHPNRLSKMTTLGLMGL